MYSNFKDGFVFAGLWWLGLHIVALGLYNSGQAHRGNLAWRMVSVVLDAEKLVLQIMAAACLLGVVGLVIFLIIECCKKPPEPIAQPVCVATQEAEIIQIDQPELTTQAVVIKPIKPPEIPVITPAPPPTAAELKRKALRQITGKEF
jgi:hypothetical protein